MRRALTAGVCLALLGALPAYGQEDRDRTTEKSTRTEVRRVSVLIGTKVTLERGESTFGKVTDIVLNDSGCIDYVIVSYDDELVPVPWGVVTYSVEEKVVTIKATVTKEKLRDIAFRSDRWPNFREDRFMRSVRTVWGEKALRRDHDRTDVGPGDRRDDRRDRRDDRRDDRTPGTKPDDRRDRRDDRRDDRTPGTKPDDRRDRRDDRRDDRTPGTKPDDRRDRRDDRTPGTKPDDRRDRRDDRTPGTKPDDRRPDDRTPGTKPDDRRDRRDDRTPGTKPDDRRDNRPDRPRPPQDRPRTPPPPDRPGGV